MKTLHSLSLVAALGLASTVYAQAPTNPPGPTASSMTGTQAAKLVGAKVEMPNGEALGEVKDVVVDKQGNASYAVVSYGVVMGLGGKRTAVPWATVQASMQDDKLIMDRTRLEQAPVLVGMRTPDVSNGTWSRDADNYWRAK